MTQQDFTLGAAQEARREAQEAQGDVLEAAECDLREDADAADAAEDGAKRARNPNKRLSLAQ